MNSTLDDDARTADELPCPVPGCDYENDDPQGIAAHVGNHPGGWDAATYTPRDAHQHATAGDERASRLVARVEHYLALQGVMSDRVVVYYHFGYQSVQIAIEGRLDSDVWTNYREATDVDGIRYVGGGLNYCKDRFVAGLDDPPTDGEMCVEPHCFREDTLAPIVEGGEAVTLCRSCRKEALGVSS